MTDVNNIAMNASIYQAQAVSVDRQAAVLQSELQKKSAPDIELQEVSEQFESLMLNFMIREMRATVPEGTLLPRSMAEDLFSGMLDERIAGEMATHGGIGISRMIFEQLQSTKQDNATN